MYFLSAVSTSFVYTVTVNIESDR